MAEVEKVYILRLNPEEYDLISNLLGDANDDDTPGSLALWEAVMAAQ